MIEIDINPNSSLRSALLIDGEVIENVKIRVPFQQESRRVLFPDSYIVETYNIDTFNQILSQRFTDIPEIITRLLYRDMSRNANINDLPQVVNIERETKLDAFRITFIIRPHLFIWKKPYSFEQFIDKIKDLYEDQVLSPRIVFKSLPFSNGVSIFLYVTSENYSKRIIDEVNDFNQGFHHCYNQAYELLNADPIRNSVEVILDLPEPVRVACEQYLLYFVQFLKDLGINVSSELKHDAGQVLFSVTPDDKDDALDKIRAALELYLNLPSSKLVGTASVDNAIEIQRLVANVQHLQGQLVLAQAIIQAKDATIQSNQLTISRQQYLLEGVINFSALFSMVCLCTLPP